MSLKIIGYAKERMRVRGATKEEVEEVLKSGKSTQAKKGKKAKEAIFSFNNHWQGKFYEQKKVKLVYKTFAISDRRRFLTPLKR